MKPTSACASAWPELWRALRRTAPATTSAAPATAAKTRRPRLTTLSDTILTSPAWLRNGHRRCEGRRLGPRARPDQNHLADEALRVAAACEPGSGMPRGYVVKRQVIGSSFPS
jgi:hypothetical protein